MDEFDYIPGLVPSPFASSAAPKLDRDDSLEEINVSVSEPEQAPAADPRIAGLRRLLALIVAVLALTMMFCSVMYVNTKINSDMRAISELSSDIKEAQAENIRLHAEFSSMVSADKVRNYAVAVLGMQKIERYQIHYFENRSGNTVVVANGKTQNVEVQNS